VVVPSLDGAADELSDSGAAAGSPPPPAAGSSSLVHAPSATVRPARAPTAASRWIFLTESQLLFRLPGGSGLLPLVFRSVERSGSARSDHEWDTTAPTIEMEL
jgi:hypothetical protein